MRRALADLFILTFTWLALSCAFLCGSFSAYAATQCQNGASCSANAANAAPAARDAQTPPPAPPVAGSAIVYNPWYPGNVIPFFSAYPFIDSPYTVYERPVPAPVPVPPTPPQVAHAPPVAQVTPPPPVAPPDHPYVIAGIVPYTTDLHNNPPYAPCPCGQ